MSVPRGLAPPLELSTAFETPDDPTTAEFTYARDGHPTTAALETALGELEQAGASVLASGQAASTAALWVLTRTHPRVVVGHDGYYLTRVLAGELARAGVTTTVVDLADRAATAAALAAGPCVLWLETPSNPWLSVHDLRALARLGHDHGAVVVADNTLATPALQQPLDDGVDVVVTALTKATTGHGDVLLGAVTTRDSSVVEQVRRWRSVGGAAPAPQPCWLAHRSLTTLRLRTVAQSVSARALAELLASHPRVTAVHHPDLGDDAELARRQMPAGRGPLCSFELDATAAQTDAVLRAATHVRVATSFGGAHSTWERRARWPGETVPASLVRLSVGLEPLETLRVDVLRALDA